MYHSTSTFSSRNLKLLAHLQSLHSVDQKTKISCSSKCSASSGLLINAYREFVLTSWQSSQSRRRPVSFAHMEFSNLVNHLVGLGTSPLL